MTSRDARDPDALLARAGVRGDPDRDQHFLVDDRVLDRLPGYLPRDTDTEADVDADTAASDAPGHVSGDACEHVLEIGGGTGALTDRLLAVADRVTVVERDPRLADFLREEFAADRKADRLAVVEGDALEVDLPDFTASVSNLPYGVASEVVFRLLPRRKPLVLMLQREFAERMAADPGTPEYGRLSVTAGHYADVEIVEPVPREAFAPPPAVASAVVRTTPRDPDYEVPDDDLFVDLVRACFTQRRKTMRNAVRNTAHISGLDDPEAVVDAAGDRLMEKRAGAVTPAEFARLARIAADQGEPS